MPIPEVPSVAHDSTRNSAKSSRRRANPPQGIRKRVGRWTDPLQPSSQCEPQRRRGTRDTNLRREVDGSGPNRSADHQRPQQVSHNDRSIETTSTSPTRLRARRRPKRWRSGRHHASAGIRDAAHALPAAKTAAIRQRTQRRPFEISRAFWTSEQIKKRNSESDQLWNTTHVSARRVKTKMKIFGLLPKVKFCALQLSFHSPANSWSRSA
jgi:hypothetical protein